MIGKIRKALIPTIAGLIVVALSRIGIGPEMSIQDAANVLAGSLVTSMAVWATPNKK